MDAPGLDLIERVREPVSRHARRTPLLRSEWLSAAAGAPVYLKCENLQITGSFKVRGALAALAEMPAEIRRNGVTAASAGNHGLGLAYAASVLGAPCTVVVPGGAPDVKVQGIEALGARVVRSPFPGYDKTQEWALERMDDLGGVYVSAFEDPAIMAGNGGTTFLEILEDLPEIETLIVPVGGGGFAIGAGAVVRARAPEVRVIGVNTDASPGMWLSRRDRRAHLTVESAPTICEGLEGGVSEATYTLGLETIHEVVLARESSIRRAVGEILHREHLVVEGSGAAGVAALLDGAAVLGPGPAAVVLTGGNIDPGRLAGLSGPSARTGG